jgi:bifunctional non-homologous end joining protein LigD
MTSRGGSLRRGGFLVRKIVASNDTGGKQLAYQRAYHVKSLTGLDSADPVEGKVLFASLEQPAWPDAGARRLVFDLDPASDVPFDAVVEAARDLRERLETLGLASFCKTTGARVCTS